MSSHVSTERRAGGLEVGKALADEDQLWQRRHTDPRAKDELVARYLPFARRLAGRYRNNYESFDDLVQVASVGLVNAINRFDPDQGSPFTAFASPTIHGELKRYFRDKVWLVRVPRGIQEEIQALDQATDDLSAELHRQPTREELSQWTNLNAKQVDEAILAKSERNPVSFEMPIDEEGRSRGERYGREDPGYALLEDSDEIRTAMEELDDTERLVLRLRFIDDMTQTQIAERIGFSQMHVSREIRRSVAKLMEKAQLD